MRAPKQQAGGAFGQPRSHAYERDALDDAKGRVAEQVASQYSYQQIRDFADRMERDRLRAEEIAEMFAEYDGYNAVEEALFKQYQYKLGQSRERYREAVRRLTPLAKAEQRRRKAEYWRQHKERLSAAHREWQLRIRLARTEVYLRRLARERAKWWANRHEPAFLEKRRKAARECAKRKREKLKNDPVAYRAFLDARNAKRTKQRARPRWGAVGPQEDSSRKHRRKLREDAVAYRAHRDRENERRRGKTKTPEQAKKARARSRRYDQRKREARRSAPGAGHG